MEHNPIETEAEAHIQSALDDLDPTMGGGHIEAQENILGSVDQEAQPSMFQDDKSERTPPKKAEAKLPLYKPATHRSAKSTAENLFDLTKDLRDLQRRDSQSSSTGSFFSGQRNGSGDEQESNVDALVLNAVTLMRRNKATIEEGRETSSTTGSETSAPKSATGRMTNLLQRAKSMKQISSHADEEEGDDEEEDRDDGDDKGGIRKDPSRSVKFASSTAKTIKKVKNKVGYKDFEDWLKFKKMSAWTYIKICLFYIMIPATVVAGILFYFAG